ncbi:NAD/NADP-dependent octopine/nopaline dehydrogenase family protein [Streptomyces catenulae]|uniref:NAD/NADP octopine/nopaline dehydrogenase family protein n=1 Tax=Streptomyces catenulae TaxID=66875 RepID=A0ABV2YYP1_9ACTN|nr:NAD/NADP octopine/nopaline dehydrogenase family protein [Streptomyces catenulae]
MDLTILGGGHGAFAAAAALADGGHTVRWWRRNAPALAALGERGTLGLRDHRGLRQVPVGAAPRPGAIRPVADLAGAVRGARLVVVPLPATAHTDLAPRLAPLLGDGQVVLLPPGTFGTVLFAEALAAAGNRARVAFAETGTLPYLARTHGPDEVAVSAYATRLPTGVFPARSAEGAFRVLREAYPAVEPVEDALSGALMNAGPVIHPPLILMNAGPLEHHASWDIHQEGTQPSIRRVTDALDAERIALRRELGYGAPHFPLADHYATAGDEWMYGRGAHGRLTDSGDWREPVDLLHHRYLTEDTRLGLSFLVSTGRWAGCPTPVAQGLLSIASAVTGTDLYARGRTWESLGLAGLTRPALRELLQEGFSR